MRYPTDLEAGIIPTADFSGVSFARSCRHEKRERRPPRMGLNEYRRTLARKADMNTSRKKKPIAVRLEFHCGNARTVCIAGTFNGWNPKSTTMVSTGQGQWLKDLSLRPGSYEYQYVVDGKWINDPQAVKSTPNPYGGRNSVLVVEANNTKSGTFSQPGAFVPKTPGEKGGSS